MSETVDVAVIGAGVIGLAVARALAQGGHEVVVLEKNGAIGEETSARNSEVIHAGLYYPAGSLKAQLCVAGNRQLYEYCEAKGVPHSRCGKVVVAITSQQHPKLDALQRSAAANGVNDLERLGPADVEGLEPNVRAAGGLWSPSTGIVDSHALMLALRGDLERAGGSVAVLSRFVRGSTARDSLHLRCDIAGEPFDMRARTVVNAAGLHAANVARALPSLARDEIPTLHYAKGNYFVHPGRSPFAHLVYPLPDDGGLGIHATLDLAGRIRFGPDVQWLPMSTSVDALDYAVDAGRAAAFYSAVRSYWPGLADGGLSPAYSGVRPKLSGSGEPPADFSIRCAGDPRAREVHLFGFESPGLTAALAIGDRVAALIGR